VSLELQAEAPMFRDYQVTGGSIPLKAQAPTGGSSIDKGLSLGFPKLQLQSRKDLDRQKKGLFKIMMSF
jgi:hypothetical protein